MITLWINQLVLWEKKTLKTYRLQVPKARLEFSCFFLTNSKLPSNKYCLSERYSQIICELLFENLQMYYMNYTLLYQILSVFHVNQGSN